MGWQRIKKLRVVSEGRFSMKECSLSYVEDLVVEEDVGVMVGPRAARGSCRDVPCDPSGDVAGYLTLARLFLAVDPCIHSQVDTARTDAPLQMRMPLQQSQKFN